MSTIFDHKAPCTNISCQLGWGVHYFGPQSPMYKHIMPVRLIVHYFRPQSLMYKHIMPVRLGCPLLRTTKPHVQTYHASWVWVSTTLDQKPHRQADNTCKIQIYRTRSKLRFSRYNKISAFFASSFVRNNINLQSKKLLMN